MSTYSSKLQIVQASGALQSHRPYTFRNLVRETAETPISQQLLTWLLLWTLLCLSARQWVYIAGPARTAISYQNGYDGGLARGSRVWLFIQLFVFFAFVVTGSRHVLDVARKNLAIPLMLGLAFLSARWSASAQITLQVDIQLALCTLFACYLSARYTTERFMQLLIFLGVVSGLLDIVFALGLPSYGIFQGYGGDAWQGICNHKNTLGIAGVYLLSPIFFTDSYSRWRRVAYGALQLFLIVMSQSRGAWGYTLGMLLFIGWMYLLRRVTGRELTLMVAVSSLVVLSAAISAVYFWPQLALLLGKDASMTGRTQIYHEVWLTILKRPGFGYGFGGFWFPGSLESQRISIALGWPGIGYAENGVLELALQVGLVGVAIVSFFMLRAFIQGLRLLRSPVYSPRVGWFLTILVIAFLTNIDAGWLMSSDTLDWILIVVACVGLNRETSLLKEITA
jgi:exopolysaccharide production protein ExoQ